MGNCYDRTKPGFLLFIDQFSQRPYKEETLHSAETLEQKNHKQVKIKHKDKYRDKTILLLLFFSIFPAAAKSRNTELGRNTKVKYETRVQKNKKDDDKAKDKYTHTQLIFLWFSDQFSRPYTEETLRSPRTSERKELQRRGIPGL